MSNRNDPYAEEKRLAAIAGEYGIAYEQAAAIDATAERLKVALMHAISPKQSPNGLPRALLSIDDLLAVATGRPDETPVRELSLAELGLPARAVNFYEGRHQVTTVGELLDLGPIPQEAGKFFGWHLLQQTLLGVIGHLVARVDGAHRE